MKICIVYKGVQVAPKQGFQKYVWVTIVLRSTLDLYIFPQLDYHFRFFLFRHWKVILINRKNGNNQRSIKLPNTFRSQTPKGKKDGLKAMTPQSKHYKQKAKRTVSFPNICQTAIQNKNFTRTYMQRHTDSKPQQKHRLKTVNKYIITARGWGRWVGVWGA